MRNYALENPSQRLRSIKDRLAALSGTAARTLWEYGVLFAEVERDGLWREDDVASFDAWVEQVVGTSRETARKAMVIAEHFSADMAERFGTEKVAAAIRYLEATGRHEQPGDLLALHIRVRGDDGTYTSIPFADASYRQIREAARHVQERRRAGTSPEADPELKQRLRALSNALPEAARPKRGPAVKLARTSDGRPGVRFGAVVPLDELESFVEALREHLVRR